MEQLAKQNNNIEHQAKAVAVSSNCKYRALIFKVLERLQFATLEVIERDTDRDNFMSATEAAEYGLVDSVMTKRD